MSTPPTDAVLRTIMEGRWRGGMLATDERGVRWRRLGCGLWHRDDGEGTDGTTRALIGPMTPDLTDPATVGCCQQILREHDQELELYRYNIWPSVYHIQGHTSTGADTVGGTVALAMAEFLVGGNERIMPLPLEGSDET